MKTENTIVVTKKISPLLLENATVGIEINEADDVILNYLSHFFSFIRCENVKFVHAIPSPPIVDVIPYEGMEDIVLNSQWIAQLREKLIASVPDNFPVENIEFKIKEGTPLETLVEEAEIDENSLLIIGQESDQYNHDISAKSMARSTTGNALIIPEKSKATTTHIMVPIDFSPFSIDALKYAISIAEACDHEVRISCINVYNVPDLSSYKISRTPKQLESIYQKSHLQMLNKLVADFDTDIRFSTAVLRKDMPGIAYYLLNYAEENNADLIVMGAKGHSRFELLLMGSVTEKLLTLNQSIPTVVIK